MTKGVVRNFAELTGKHLCQGLFFDKVTCLESCNLIKKRLWQMCFSVNFAKFVRMSFVTEHLWTTGSEPNSMKNL